MMSTSRNTQRVQPWQWVVFAAVVALPVVVALAALPTMPEQVVMHWGVNGKPDRWGSPWTVLLMPAFGLLLAGLMVALTLGLGADDDSGRTERHLFRATLLSALMWGAMSLALVAQVSGRVRLPARLDFDTIMFIGGGTMIAVLGNAMSVAPPNSLFGVRVPHADQSADVWRRTQLFGGRLLILTGVVTIISALVLPSTVTFWILMALLILSSFLSSVHAKRIAAEECSGIERLGDGEQSSPGLPPRV